MNCRSYAILQSLLVLGVWAVFSNQDAWAQAALQASPSSIVLDNPEATQQVLVRSSKLAGDLTRVSRYEIIDPKIASVDSTG